MHSKTVKYTEGHPKMSMRNLFYSDAMKRNIMKEEERKQPKNIPRWVHWRVGIIHGGATD